LSGLTIIRGSHYQESDNVSIAFMSDSLFLHRRLGHNANQLNAPKDKNSDRG
jgi:hypothetical protein